ncbi:hypothetical protein JOD54_002078 [Actinokineospora baliensis]|uniref:hypothetical protein n=1 Tax=Actinokineospora baliensis TaxID=547056 RepID=UPI0019597B6F|nr:hypothetical protein [Actinokineospora baliensis]MBM7771874.1 hypothetical protein [Actinokineospora baliensis]
MNYQSEYPQQQAFHPSYPLAQSSPATAVLAGLSSLAVAGGIGGASAYFLAEFPSYGNVFDLPAGMQSILIGRLAIAALALIGAIMLFARRRAGAPVVAISAILGAASLPLEPVVSEMLRGIGLSVSDYFQALFEFNDTYTILLAVGAAAALLAFLFAILPPTGRWLRGARRY